MWPNLCSELWMPYHIQLPQQSSQFGSITKLSMAGSEKLGNSPKTHSPSIAEQGLKPTCDFFVSPLTSALDVNNLSSVHFNRFIERIQVDDGLKKLCKLRHRTKLFFYCNVSLTKKRRLCLNFIASMPCHLKRVASPLWAWWGENALKSVSMGGACCT